MRVPIGRVPVVVTLAATGLLVLVPATVAQAHPLGNFSVNHYNGLTLRPDGIDVLAVVDLAEIPTQQELPSIDSDGNDTLSADELAAHAATECADLAAGATLAVDGARAALTLSTVSLATVDGAAGLPTLRLTCALTAEADLGAAATVEYADGYRGDRVGWHEITARGEGIRLVESPVPATSVTDELRTYPQDLLSSPLDDRSVTLSSEPGEGDSVAGPGSTGSAQDPVTRLIAAGDRKLQGFLDGDLTPLLGGLSMALALLLGAGHALLPGHGKTVMAAYLAGRRGSRRDAYKVGGIVTLTHTASVLVLGLAITVSASIVGEQLLRYLGVVSGLLIALVGGLLLRDALRSRRAMSVVPARTVALAHSHDDGHSHSHDDGHTHGHSHDDGHSHSHDDEHTHSHDDEHAHSHDDEHAHSHHGSHVHGEPAAAHAHGVSGWLSHDHDHGPGGHTHAPGSTGRAGLIGMGIAGGLVPSPSALVVLLGSVALGRTVFGVLLVLLYGVGMAATLTAVGLLLVRVRGRLDRFDAAGRGTAVRRLTAALPVVTASLVLVVGLGLALRGVISPV